MITSSENSNREGGSEALGVASGREKRHLLRAQLWVSAAGEFLFHYYFLLFSNGTDRDNEKGNRAINTVYSGNPAEVLK